MIFTDKRLSLCSANWRRKTLPWYKSDVAASAEFQTVRIIKTWAYSSWQLCLSYSRVPARLDFFSCRLRNVHIQTFVRVFDSYATPLTKKEKLLTFYDCTVFLFHFHILLFFIQTVLRACFLYCTFTKYFCSYRECYVDFGNGVINGKNSY